MKEEKTMRLAPATKARINLSSVRISIDGILGLLEEGLIVEAQDYLRGLDKHLADMIDDLESY